jgi:uncharacterized membrane protein
MKTKGRLIFLIFFLFLFFFSFTCYSSARENVSYWYIKDFRTTLNLNKDSTLLVEEKIIADCGHAKDKHGIFRVLPTRVEIEGQEVITPIELISITDFNDNSVEYSVINNYEDSTITWKIGDPDKTVKGENEYKIVYRVKNIIRTEENSDLFHWNILGNFWDMEIDNFNAEIILPSGINRENVDIDYYTGHLGSKSKYLASYKWKEENKIIFYSHRTIDKKEGITVKISFPRNTFEVYSLSFWEKTRKDNFWFVLPIFFFFLLLFIWNKYGRDPRIKKSLMPFYEVPENLSPIEMGMLITNGSFNNKLIPATIVNFAVKRIISIEKIKKKNFFSKDDFSLKVENINKLEKVSSIEKMIFERIFGKEKEVRLSSLKRKFPVYIKEIDKRIDESLTSKGLLSKKSFQVQGFLVLAIFVMTLFFLIISKLTSFISLIPLRGLVSALITYLIFVVFLIFMPRRTAKGTDLLWKIKGYELYMRTAEEHRQKFYEKENIFEKNLPYAMVFGIADLWVKKMKEMHYIDNYHPVWFAGGSFSQLDVDSFVSELDNLSSNISHSTGTSGGAGGGSGGGGGGGW